MYQFLGRLGTAAGSRAERKEWLASIRTGKYAGMDNLEEKERDLIKEAARDLDASLADIPDSSLPADWKYLCATMVRGLRSGPRPALAALDEVRRSILAAGGARMFLVASAASQQGLGEEIRGLAAALEDAPAKKAAYAPARRIDLRLGGREPEAGRPVFVGLLNANSQGGVFLNSAPGASYHDTDRDKLLDYLASNLYAGHGAHGVFITHS